MELHFAGGMCSLKLLEIKTYSAALSGFLRTVNAHQANFVYGLTFMNYSITDQPNSGTWDQVLQERGAYHPEVEYFMVDYFDQDHCAHIRLPFLRQEQVFQVFTDLQVATKRGANIRSLRVLPEKFLDESYGNPDIVEEAIAAGVEDAKFLGASTRKVLFDKRYEAIAKSFKTKALSNQ